MPFVIMRRTDIPVSVLQVLDLEPNTSLRNQIYEPPGQTQYIRPIPTNETVATTGAGPITTNDAYDGLAAYYIDRVQDQAVGVPALTAAIANEAATSTVGRATTGGTLLAADIAEDLTGAGAAGGTSLTAGASTGVLTDVLEILSGRVYTLPGGTAVEDAGNEFIATIDGDFETPFKRIQDTSGFTLSAATGHLLGYLRADFEYAGTAGAALQLYNDDGSIVTV